VCGVCDTIHFMKILLLEDDTVLADILVDFLSEHYNVTHTYSMQEALVLAENGDFALYIFDINVPDGNGISLLKVLRSFSDSTPTIFITAFDDTEHLKSAFEAGGDDFIKKPFELEELFLRIERLKRHFGLQSVMQLSDKILFYVQKEQIVKNSSETISLTHKEAQCLHYLYQNRARIISTQELLQQFWEFENMPSDDAIRTIIKNLRKYIGKEHIINIRGQGYKFE